MFRNLVTLLTVACSLSSTFSAPIQRREVPQEHSHEQFLTTVRASLNLNNPNAIQDPVFGLLGNAAAAGGAGKITDATCLQQATADQAFTNAKAAGDVNGQVAALIYRALERNSGAVGLVTAPCTSIKAVNPEIAAIAQHQDPASTNAAAVNKAITLELAKQIAAVGGDPQDALKSGTFAPGTLGDPTAKGNTCDTTNDPVGCIFTQNLLVEDATAAEISAAVAAVSGSTATTTSAATAATDAACPDATTVTLTVTATVDAAAATTAAVTTAAAATATTAAASTSGNLQTFTGNLGGVTAPAVTTGGRGLLVAGSDSFLNLSAALGRSCDIQHNGCADVANSAAGRASGLTVGQCDTQNTQCHAVIN
ncbi:hypothetical protein HYPSUDRAFT_67958 [Hypholoma sublateritium FD-334 SS-4]|uniref:Uncharacterized protein n=1 Tax=Hypholoma sublateritium (strain FD-334 SS-4) TaxID=945553 RepID=A0A0D2NXM8_HYPSF|nr:hypothetical protein HYPSUDRAFT_67958 [Hypholoma sublateritium FD-334 SS-4]